MVARILESDTFKIAATIPNHINIKQLSDTSFPPTQFEQQKTRTCVPHTPYIWVLKLASFTVGCMEQPRTRLVEIQATACFDIIVEIALSIRHFD